MKKIELYTEDIYREYIIEVLNEYFTSYSIFEGIGFWKGKQENSICIVLIMTQEEYNLARDKIDFAAGWIKRGNMQESVLITITEIDGVFI